MKTEKEKTLSEEIKDIEEIIKLVRKNKLSLKRELKLVECLETLIKKQKQFIKEILDEIEKHIDNKEELKLAYKMHKDMGEYGRGYMDCYEQTNDVFKELKDKIKQKAGGKLI